MSALIGSNASSRSIGLVRMTTIRTGFSATYFTTCRSLGRFSCVSSIVVRWGGTLFFEYFATRLIGLFTTCGQALGRNDRHEAGFFFAVEVRFENFTRRIRQEERFRAEEASLDFFQAFGMEFERLGT